MKANIGINGFGRIGRIFLRQALKQGMNVVAINSRGPIESHYHLFKYDSTYGTFDQDVKMEGDFIVCGKNRIRVFREDLPENIPWSSVKTDIVIESTGVFVNKKDAQRHLQGTVKKVIISAPGKDDDGTFVMGVNEKTYNPKTQHVISNASCTTNCLAPVAKVLHETFGIIKGQMTTIHAFTNDQNILDNTHKKDMRRARTATASLIPTTTGAAEAVGKVLPELNGKLTGISVRTSHMTVSLVDLVVLLKKNVTAQEVNQAIEKASKTSLKGILSLNMEPLVSIDYKGCEISSVVDGLSTAVIDGNLLKILSWYDNEWGYTARLIDLTKYVGEKL